MKNWEDITPGILADFAIKGLCPSKLITKHYDESFVKQACYELRVGEIVWHTYIRKPESRKVSIKDQSGVYLPSRAYATIMTMEEVDLPADCVGRIMTKGQLFSIGISAVNTYVDPGFSGPLGITLINHSSKPIFIPIGQAIAKIEFIKLNMEVEDPYKGPHLKAGDLWPIPDSYYNIPSEIDAKTYPEDLKDPIIKEIENKITSLENRLTTKTHTILTLFIIIIPLIVSSILYWISNWASMTSAVRTLIIIIGVAIGALAAITYWWKTICGFLELVRKRK